MVLVVCSASLAAVAQVSIVSPVNGSTVTTQVRVMGTSAATKSSNWISKVNVSVDGTALGGIAAILC
jgi:hypothetical protein